MWGGALPTHLEPLVILQKRIIRIISGAEYLAHTSPLFKSLKILKFQDIYRFRVAIYAFKNKIELASRHSRNHNYNTRNRANLLPDFERLQTTQKSILCQAPNIWNSIPENLKQLPSVSLFKKHYKKYLLEVY